MIRLSSLTFLALLLSCSYSIAMDAPANCRFMNVKYEHGQLVLLNKTKSQQQLFLIHNTGGKNLWLQSQTTEKPFSGVSKSQVPPSRWAAITFNTANFKLDCVEVQPGAEQVVPCEKVLKVCRISNAKFGQSTVGNYWIAEDESLDSIMQSLKTSSIL